MNKIKIRIAKLVCKWFDFAGMGSDKDILELKKSVSDYEASIVKRKRG